MILNITSMNIRLNYKQGGKPMGAVSAFTTGTTSVKPPMTDVIVIHNLANEK